MQGDRMDRIRLSLTKKKAGPQVRRVLKLEISQQMFAFLNKVKPRRHDQSLAIDEIKSVPPFLQEELDEITSEALMMDP